MSLTDKEYYNLTMSISKALSNVEAPIKVKHVRAAIIGTFHSKGGHAFWAIAIRQPVQENRIVAWKFCHLLHKILREGHPHCCQHSMRHRGMLTEAGKLWGHLNDGYGICIKHYTKLLVTKLEFHDRNPRIPGSLALKPGELEQIGGGDINFYFQLAVEIFDYLDDIIALQATIFNSITTFCVSSMTSPGQCRLAPLIPCIQDSNPLYDFVVRIMFKLHANLPSDLLTGHRERFRTLFHQLKSFYNQSRNLQYFVNLITVPKLPDAPPNFEQQSDLGNYQAPVVVMPDSEPMDNDAESIISESLIDTSEAAPPIPELPHNHHQNHVQQAAPNYQLLELERLLKDRDDLIRHLQMEIERLTNYVKALTIEQRDVQQRLEEQINQLNSQLTHSQGELSNLRIQKQELELRAQSAPTLEQKAHAEEERAKASEEKFQKLKTMYTQIRDEHVQLLRQHGEISRQLASSNKSALEATSAKEEIRIQLTELQQKQAIVTEQLQQSSSDAKQEQEAVAAELQDITEKYETLQTKYQEMEANRQAEIAELRISLERVETELATFKTDRETLQAEKGALESSLGEIQLEREQLSKQYDDVLLKVEKLNIESEERTREEASLQQSVSEKAQHAQELLDKLDQLQRDYELLQKQHIDLEVAKAAQEQQFNRTHEADLQKLESLQCEMTEKVTSLSAEKENILADKENQFLQLTVLQTESRQRSSDFESLEKDLKNVIEQKDHELEELRAKYQELEEKYQSLNANMDRLLTEKGTIESDLQDLLHQQDEMDQRYQDALATMRNLENSLVDAKISGETALRTLLEACIKSSEKLALRAISENEMPGAGGTPTYFLMIAEELQEVLSKLAIVHENYRKDNSTNVESLARKVIIGAHLLASAHVQGMSICNRSANIECGERIAEEIKELGGSIAGLFQSLHKTSESDCVATKIADLRSKLQKVTSMIGDLSKQTDGTENLGDLVENELSSMDKAIEEAAAQIEEMLSKSRASDSGIKLEVNEKILDACTNLMQAIRILVQKSRLLQSEIVALGKGSASAKEFYKRNHQWTEGLISAAKSVAQGANFLVTAANKTVAGGSRHQLDLIVAAQEIAACTAQLVVASRVKAPRGSQNLAALGTASKNVTQATGIVVATAKDCSQRLEDSQDLDLGSLTVHQAKTKEMEIQVKVLELEQALQMERMKLAAFRKKNYQSPADE
ncbi:huntingtin-interacting protein 1 isoform X2 [Sabethes cyaneus]|uniref:huntingtin-interacting protein 1 isoform X2 n=1 Tax=Sabethes cyaneus TaxID=53552 RepID=UPI00237E9546|nr:huntingtin-interacting protein 1 isoform X2 [Sabethes cyaneus]XP_053683503.1 huntingtin-interacting protein 1 isoform X2 [Sabethes cyaneus]XP_053683504.1 huntingtin-interacting protein 1 isoform X2 [Sabethes cyaneus]